MYTESELDLVRQILGAVDKNGAFPNADAVSRRVQASRALVTSLLTPADSEALETLARVLEESAEFIPVPSNPSSLSPYYRSAPIYSIFESWRWVRESDLIRAIALMAALRANKSAEGVNKFSGAFSALGQFLRSTLREKAAADSLVVIRKASEVLASSEETFADDLEEYLQWLAEGADGHVSESHGWAIASIANLAISSLQLNDRRRGRAVRKSGGSEISPKPKRAGRGTRAKKRYPARLTSKIQKKRHRDAVNGGLAPGDVVAPYVDYPVIARSIEDLESAEIIAMRAHRIMQTRPFSLNSNECLGIEEAKVLFDLLSEMSDAPESTDEVKEASDLLLLQLFSSQSLLALAELSWSARTGRSGTLTPAGMMTLDVPDYEEFRKYHSPHSVLPVLGVVAITMPSSVVRRLLNRRRKRRLFDTPSKLLHDRALRLLVKIRRKLPRATVDRIAGHMPAAVYEACADVRRVQLALGSTFGLSSAPLFYYSPQNSELNRLHSKCVGQVVGECPVGGFDDWFVGSNLGPCLMEVQQCVRAFDQKIEGLKALEGNGPKSNELWFKLLNAVSRKTAWLFSAASGWRNTNAIGVLKLSNFSLDFRSALVADKVDVCSPVPFRLVALGSTVFPAQMQTLLRLYQKFLSTSESRIGLDEVRRTVRNALDSQGPLFLAIDEAGQVPAADAQWLGTALPSDLQMPMNFLRHSLSTQLTNFGASATNLYHQLGHESFADLEFGGHSVQVPAEAVEDLHKQIDDLLAEQGWTPTQVSAKNYPLLERDFDWRVLKAPKKQAQIERSNPDAAAPDSDRLTRAEHERIREGVYEFFESEGNLLSPLLADNVEVGKIPKDALHKVVQEICKSQDLDCRFAVKRSIRERIGRIYAANADSDDQGVVMRARMPHFRYWSLPHIVPTTLSSSNGMRLLRNEKERQDVIGELDAVSSVSLDLLLWHPIRSIDHLLGLINGIGSARLASGGKGELRIMLSNDSEDWLAPHLALRISRHADALGATVTNKVVNDAVSSWLEKIVGKAARRNWTSWLIDLGHECGALEWPGYLWADVTARRSRKSVPASRLEQVRSGTLKGPFPFPKKANSRVPAGKTDYLPGEAKLTWAAQRTKIRQALTDSDGKDKRAGSIEELKRLKNEFLDEDGVNIPSVICCSFALSLLSPTANKQTGKRLAIDTVRGYLNIGIRAIRLLYSPSSFSLSVRESFAALLSTYSRSDEGEQVELSGSYFKQKREALIRLHELLVKELGMEPIDPEDWPLDFGGGVGEPYAELMSDSEYQYVQQLIETWEGEARLTVIDGVSPRVFRAARMSLAFQFRFGLRPGEASGLTTANVFLGESGPELIYVCWNSIRRIKSFSSMRPVSVQSALSPDELSLLTSLIDEIKSKGAWDKPEQPLLVTSKETLSQLEVVGRIVRLALAVALGEDKAKQNISRHAATNNEFAQWLPRSVLPEKAVEGDDFSDIWSISRRRGHSDNAITQTNYVHIDHLATAGLHADIEISKAHLAALLQMDIGNRRKWAKKLATRLEINPAKQSNGEPAVAIQIFEGVKRSVAFEVQPVANAPICPSLPQGIRLKTPSVSFVNVVELLGQLSRGRRWASAAFPLDLLVDDEHRALDLICQLATHAPALGISQDVFITAAGNPLISGRILREKARKGASLRRPNLKRALEIATELSKRPERELLSLGRSIFSHGFWGQFYPSSRAPEIQLSSADAVMSLASFVGQICSCQSAKGLGFEICGSHKSSDKLLAEMRGLVGGPPIILTESDRSELGFSLLNESKGRKEPILLCFLMAALAVYTSIYMEKVVP